MAGFIAYSYAEQEAVVLESQGAAIAGGGRRRSIIQATCVSPFELNQYRQWMKQ